MARKSGEREPEFASPMYENNPRDSNYPVQNLPKQMGTTADPLGLLRDAEASIKSDTD